MRYAVSARHAWAFLAVAIVAAAAAFALATWHYKARIDGLVATLQTKEFPTPHVVDRWHMTTVRVSDPVQAAKIDNLTKLLARAKDRIAQLDSNNLTLTRKIAVMQRVRRVSDHAQIQKPAPAPEPQLTPEQQLVESADSDGIYQHGARVGTANGIITDLRNGVVRFGEITGNGALDPDADFQFRNLTLHMAGRSDTPGASVTAMTQADVWENVICRVVGVPASRE